VPEPSSLSFLLFLPGVAAFRYVIVRHSRKE
jgi:hypothetical protein